MLGTEAAPERGLLTKAASRVTVLARRTARRPAMNKTRDEIVSKAAPLRLAILRAIGTRCAPLVRNGLRLRRMAWLLPCRIGHASGERRREGRGAHHHQTDVFRALHVSNLHAGAHAHRPDD